MCPFGFDSIVTLCRIVLLKVNNIKFSSYFAFRERERDFM